MKKIYYFLIMLLALATATSCTEEEPFSTASPDDYPRIIDPIFPDRVDGELPVVANISRDANFEMTLTVTPADYCMISWRLDGEEVAIGDSINISLMAGTYDFKVVVSTEAGDSTSREGLVQVNPLDGDPWATEVGFERIVAPSNTARLYGDNLSQVDRIVIGGQTVTEITYVESADGNYIEYTVPEGTLPGTYRIILVDAAGNEYGGDKVTVTTNALITEGAERTSAGGEWTMTGINLDKIVSLTLGDQTVSEFVRQSATEIALVCPTLPDGDYTLSGTTNDGQAVEFYTADSNETEPTVTVSSMTVLWEGHHYVSWDLADDDPNKTFNLIGKDVFATLKAGAVLSIHYSIEPADEYHQLRTTTGWWNDLPGTAVIDITTDGVKDVTLTQEVLDLIQAEDGFLCVGHGFYVDMVTVQ